MLFIYSLVTGRRITGSGRPITEGGELWPSEKEWLALGNLMSS